MAHYAILDSNNIVTTVIVGRHEGEDGIDWEEYYGQALNGTCRRTSYNTQGGIHLNGGTPFRKNYAGIGYKYDSILDAFVAPKPYQSWVLNDQSCIWEAPIPYPSDGSKYIWDENSLSWVFQY